MELEYAYFAQEAKWVDGLLDVKGAGWRTYEIERFPQRFEAVLVLGCEIEAWEEALTHQVGVWCFRDLELVSRVGIEVEFPLGVRRYVRVVDLTDIYLEQEGDYSVDIWLDGKCIKSIDWKVKAKAEPVAVEREANRARMAD
jgi:hypothetical protein